MTRPLVVAGSGVTQVFGVRFKPGAAAAFFRAPLFHLTDTRIDLCHLWSNPLALIDQVRAAHTNQDRINLVATALMSRFIDQRPAQRKVALAVHMLSRRPECSVDRLCRELSITRQGLAKGFRNNLGISPKTLARILRMQLALKLVHRNNGHTGCLTDVALCAGYYDQPHMINEFRQLTGLTPLQLRDEK